MSGTCYRAPIALRSIDEAAREATIVAATEAAVAMPHGAEVLLCRPEAVDLARYRANPVILDTHNGATIDAVIGSAREVEVASGLILVRARFASTERGTRAWELVRTGHLKGASIGYVVTEARHVRAGEVDPCGARGPAIVATRWTLLEVSLCPVGADALAGVRSRGAATLSPFDLISDDELLATLKRVF
ncbi:MAG: hypothetical protein KF878_10275 [Planctomycetes bacterium]|nr:hypothetical protein [Planctomycetota bacterium]